MSDHDALREKAPHSRPFGLPRTGLGWCSVALGLVFFALVALFNTLVSLGMRGGRTFFANPWLALTALAILGSGVAGGVLGLMAIIWKRERSVLLFLALLMAGWVLIVTGKIIEQRG